MTGEEPRIASLKWWDIEAVAAMDAAVFGPDAWSAETFWACIAAPERRFVSLWIGESLAGYAGTGIYGGESDVQTIGISADFQGRGLGTYLMRELIELARRGGATTMVLEVREDNESARRLYDRLGFEQLSVRRGYYAGGKDAIVMRARI